MMDQTPAYFDLNRQSWNRRAEVHLDTDFYDVRGFLDGKTSLQDIELGLLGDLHGKRVLHLQCHFGQDSISLARLGAHVTGVDFSETAIDAARKLAAETGADATFVCCNVYDLPQHLNGTFDLVFTSYGVIGWLPDLDRWAQVVARFLSKGGRFLMVEFHPVVWMFDDAFEKVAYNYFNAGPIVETETGTYADREAPLQQQFVCWNHNLAEVVNSLIGQGLRVDTLQEYDYSPYNVFAPAVESEPGRYRIAHLGNRIPMVYALQASFG